MLRSRSCSPAMAQNLKSVSPEHLVVNSVIDLSPCDRSCAENAHFVQVIDETGDDFAIALSRCELLIPHMVREAVKSLDIHAIRPF